MLIFGQAFPLSYFFSYVANEMKLFNQVDNLKYIRRSMPMVANGPGNWLSAMESISKLNVVTNSILIWFMH